VATAASRSQTVSALQCPSRRLAVATPQMERRSGPQKVASSSGRSIVGGPGIDLRRPVVHTGGVQRLPKTGLDDHRIAVTSTRKHLSTDLAPSAALWQLLRPLAVVPDAAVGLVVADERLAVGLGVVEPVAVVDVEQLQPRVLLVFPAFVVTEVALVVVRPGPGELVLLADVQAVALPAAAAAVVVDDELAAAADAAAAAADAAAAAAAVVAAALAVAVDAV